MFLAVLLILSAGPHTAQDQTPDEKLLRDHRVAADGPGLLAYVRALTLDGADRAKIEALVEKFGSDFFDEREKASEAIKAYGQHAVPALRAGVESRDDEVAARSRAALAWLAERPGPTTAVVGVALRLAGRRRADEAAPLILRYLPFITDPRVEEDAFEALTDCPAVRKALDDKLPIRRAAAARAVGVAPEARPRLRRLLDDPDARVRLEAARSLAAGGDARAVPALIGLLTDAAVSGRAEELLFRLAGEASPTASPGDGSPAAREKWRAGWAAWWRADGGRTAPSRLAGGDGSLGHVLVAESNGYHRGGVVWEMGRRGEGLWALRGLEMPMDVRLLPGGNVLFGDNFGAHERERGGKQVWKTASNVISTQRLPNGNTFVGQSWQLLEVDRTGKEVVKYPVPDRHLRGQYLTDAVRMPNGNALWVTAGGRLTEITWPAGKVVRLRELKSAAWNSDWYRIEAGPGGRVLLAAASEGRVYEIDAEGNVLWQVKIPHAYSVTRLPNGHVLVGTSQSKLLIELDREHKVIHSRGAGNMILRLRAR